MLPPDSQSEPDAFRPLRPFVRRLALIPPKVSSDAYQYRPPFLFAKLPVQSLTPKCRPYVSPKKRRQERRKPISSINKQAPPSRPEFNNLPTSTFDSQASGAHGGLGDLGDLGDLRDLDDGFLQDAEDPSLPDQIVEIEKRQLLTLPEYWELLQWSVDHYVRISSRSYIMQDWNESNGQLKPGKFRHVVRAIDETGAMRISCDCKPKLSMACLHSQLVRDHYNEFGTVYQEGEDPESLLICKDNDTYYFTVSTRYSTDRHHSGKRTIVSHRKVWKCSSCGKDVSKKGLIIPRISYLIARSCQHIRAAEKELKSYGMDLNSTETVSQITEADFVIASRNIKAKAVSHLPIIPPEWSRLPHERHEPQYFRGGSELPDIFEFDTTSRCSCGSTGSLEDIQISELTIYTTLTAINRPVQTRYCTACRNTRGNEGPDLGKYGILNWNNRIAFSHELMNSYISQFTTSETPLYVFYQTTVNTYLSENSPPFCSLSTFLSAWFAFAELQQIGHNMQCAQCGVNPETVIADGISISFSKQKLTGLTPPTIPEPGLRNKRMISTIARSTCYIGSYRTRVAFLNALSEHDNLEKAKLTTLSLIQHQLETDNDEETQILLSALHFYWQNETPEEKAIKRFRQLLQQIFSSDSVLQLVPSAAIPHLRLYSENGTLSKSLLALIPAFGMLHYNLDSLSNRGLQGLRAEIEMHLKAVCGVLAERANDVFSDLCQSRNIKGPQQAYRPVLQDNDWRNSGCYYGKEQIRPCPFYKGRDTDVMQESFKKSKDECTKLYTTYSKNGLTGGLMAIWCPHLVCLGFHQIPKAEGRNDVFSAIFKYWEKPPHTIIYDFACQLAPYCRSREPVFFQDTLFAIDEMHATGHSNCSQACFVSNYMQVRPQLSGINSSAAECSNSGLSRIRKSISYMDQKHAILFTYMYLSVWNRKRERIFKSQAEKLLAR